MVSDITEVLNVPWISQERRINLRAFQKVRHYTESALEDSGKDIPGQVNKLK